MSKSDAILVNLLENKVVHKGKYMWKWANGKGPSLADSQTSKLFQANYVKEVGNEMVLSISGKIIAEKLKKELTKDF